MRKDLVQAHIDTQSPDRSWSSYSKHLGGYQHKHTVKLVLWFAAMFLVGFFVSFDESHTALVLTFAMLALAAPVIHLLVLPKMHQKKTVLTAHKRDVLAVAFQNWAIERYGVKVPFQIARHAAAKESTLGKPVKELFSVDGKDYLVNGTKGVFIAFSKFPEHEIPNIREVEELIL